MRTPKKPRRLPAPGSGRKPNDGPLKSNASADLPLIAAWLATDHGRFPSAETDAAHALLGLANLARRSDLGGVNLAFPEGIPRNIRLRKRAVPHGPLGGVRRLGRGRPKGGAGTRSPSPWASVMITQLRDPQVAPNPLVHPAMFTDDATQPVPSQGVSQGVWPSKALERMHGGVLEEVMDLRQDLGIGGLPRHPLGENLQRGKGQPSANPGAAVHPDVDDDMGAGCAERTVPARREHGEVAGDVRAPSVESAMPCLGRPTAL